MSKLSCDTPWDSRLSLAKELLFILACALIGIAILGVLTQGLLILSKLIQRSDPWPIWAMLLLGSVWSFVLSAACKAAEILRG